MKAKVLVVDDEKDILDLVTYNLNKEGLETETSEDGEEALRMIRKGRTT